MAVIGKRAFIYPAENFRRGMERATRGIVRVGFLKDTFRTQATGWLLTPHLVVVFWPEVGGNDTIRVRSAAGWEEDVVAAPEMLVWPEPAPEPKPPFGLVRLKKPHGGRLDLGLTTPQIDDMALLLHFPMGTPTLAVSFGRVAAVDDVWIEHVADSMAGSSGGPLFDSEWRVIGVHCLGGPQVNKAVHRGMLLRMLQSSSAWHEIARHHRLADTVSGTRERAGERQGSKASEDPRDNLLDGLLIQAALCWSFDPGRLGRGPREQLQSRVVDPTEARWSLPTRVRREALEKGGSLEELRKRLPNWRTKNAAQRVIERILAGHSS